MDKRIIPIFPLPIVQFPGALTPLHIFEPRYRKMLKDVMAGDKTFGIVFRSDETILEAERLPLGKVGCTVEVAVVQGLPDGRSNILCVGGMRYRLLSYIEGEEYEQAEIELFEDEPTFEDLSVEASRAKALFQRVLIASRKLKDESDREASEIPDLPDDAQALSFVVTAYLDIDSAEKQALLELTETGERLRQVNEVLEKLAADYEVRAAIHQVARKNGRGGKPPKIES
jgi:Lon protease-like protein